MRQAAGLSQFGPVSATVGSQSYRRSWSSVYQDAKLSIHRHWGAFGGRNRYDCRCAENNRSVWPHHSVINGAWGGRAGNREQFAPRLSSAGRNFDPDERARLLVNAGAKFAGPVAEHHEGYSM